MIITIGRQLGSGGREIGKKLSEEMGFAYYDREILEVTAKESGLSRRLFEEADESTRKGIPSAFFGMRFPFFGGEAVGFGGLSNEMLFQIQSNVIRSIAGKQSCVFIGRCADYILRERKDLLSVFICADDEDRLRRILVRREPESLSAEKARELMARIDKKRSAFYNYYSDRVWGAAASYHLCLNSSHFGVDGVVSLIQAFAEKRR
jgi:cytidylate kinase